MTTWAVLNNNDVVIDTFIWNLVGESESLMSKVDFYDTMYPNQVSRLVNIEGKTEFPGLLVKGWFFKGEEDRFYPPYPTNEETGNPYPEEELQWNGTDWLII